jgi:hypothetical protein
MSLFEGCHLVDRKWDGRISLKTSTMEIKSFVCQLFYVQVCLLSSLFNDAVSDAVIIDRLM